jgi:hypothetical protein
MTVAAAQTTHLLSQTLSRGLNVERFREPIALDPITLQLAKPIRLTLGLDALGNDRGLLVVRKIDDHFHDVPPLLSLFRGQERSIDLQGIEFELL